MEDLTMATGQQCVNSNKGKRSHLYITGGANYSAHTTVVNPITCSLTSITFDGQARWHNDATKLVIEVSRNHDAAHAADGGDPGDGTAGLLTITLTNGGAPAPQPVQDVNVTYVNDSDAAP
jgi:hypothetical protein